MKKFKIASSIFLLSTCFLMTDAQIVPRYPAAPRCIFLKSAQSLAISLVYYEEGGADGKNIKYVQGYSIDANWSHDKKGNPYLKLDFYKVPDYTTPMNINLYFDKLPDMINYYLYIPEFKPGSSISTTIPSRPDKKIAIDICCKGKPVENNKTGITWPAVIGYDITDIVFPTAIKKNN